MTLRKTIHVVMHARNSFGTFGPLTKRYTIPTYVAFLAPTDICDQLPTTLGCIN
jgi:hypothetical protein